MKYIPFDFIENLPIKCWFLRPIYKGGQLHQENISGCKMQ